MTLYDKQKLHNYNYVDLHSNTDISYNLISQHHVMYQSS